MSPEVLAALLGAALAGTAALIVQIIGATVSARIATNVASADRLAEYLASTHSAVLAITRLAVLPIREKDKFQRSVEYVEAENRTHTALNAIHLLDDPSVAAATVELNECLIELERAAETKEWDRKVWRDWREGVLGTSVDSIFAAGRSSLRRSRFDRGALRSEARRAVDARRRIANP